MNPATSDLLDAWERGRSASWEDRALLLLQAALPGASREKLSRQSIGRRDELLFRLRRSLFGVSMCGVVECPSCDAVLELKCNLDSILANSPNPGPDSHVIYEDGYRFDVALPDSNDLSAATVGGTVEQARQSLWERCLRSVHRGTESVSICAIPSSLLDRVEQRLAELDPLADVRLAAVCLGCGRNSEVVVDIVSYLWTELDGWVRRVFTEVDQLARAYGWSESSILGMSPFRRQVYLRMIAR